MHIKGAAASQPPPPTNTPNEAKSTARYEPGLRTNTELQFHSQSILSLLKTVISITIKDGWMVWPFLCVGPTSHKRRRRRGGGIKESFAGWMALPFRLIISVVRLWACVKCRYIFRVAANYYQLSKLIDIIASGHLRGLLVTLRDRDCN